MIVTIDAAISHNQLIEIINAYIVHGIALRKTEWCERDAQVLQSAAQTISELLRGK
jgi:hypothetical protein